MAGSSCGTVHFVFCMQNKEDVQNPSQSWVGLVLSITPANSNEIMSCKSYSHLMKLKTTEKNQQSSTNISTEIETKVRDAQRVQHVQKVFCIRELVRWQHWWPARHSQVCSCCKCWHLKNKKSKQHSLVRKTLDSPWSTDKLNRSKRK